MCKEKKARRRRKAKRGACTRKRGHTTPASVAFGRTHLVLHDDLLGRVGAEEELDHVLVRPVVVDSDADAFPKVAAFPYRKYVDHLVDPIRRGIQRIAWKSERKKKKKT